MFWGTSSSGADRGCRYDSAWMLVCVGHLSIEAPRCLLTPSDRHSCCLFRNTFQEQDSSFKKVEIYLTSAPLCSHIRGGRELRGIYSIFFFFRNDIIKEKSKLFPADARPKAALQPQSHDRRRIKGNLYFTRIQKAPHKAHCCFILPLQHMLKNQTDRSSS